MPLKLNSTSGGSVTLQEPTTASNRTLTLPDATGTVNTSGAVNEVPAGSASAPSIFPTGDTNTGIFFPAADTIAFAEGGVESARIDSSGRLLIGASSFTQNTSSFGAGSLYVNESIFINNSAGTGSRNVRFDGYADELYLVWANGNTDNNNIKYAYGGTAWVNTSDETLKDIIEPISDAANKVCTLRAVIGKFKNEEEGARHPFLIAQDVQAVLPEAVYVNKGRVEGEPDTLGVGYTDTIPLLVAAIKEQQAMIEELKAKVAALEAK
jgi:hypothetical protein